MRLIRFDPYTSRNDGVPNGRLLTDSVVSRAWWLLWMAINNHPAGTKEQTALGWKAYGKLKSSSIGDGDSRCLNSDGAELYFEEEFRILNEALENFRKGVSLANADALIYLDKLLAEAPTVTPEELAAKAKGKDE